MRPLLIIVLAMALLFPGCLSSDSPVAEDTSETLAENNDPVPVVGSCSETVTRAGLMTFTTPETGVDDVDDTTMFRCPFTAADPEGVHAYEYAVIVAEWDTGMDPFASNGWLRVHSNACSYGPEDAPGVILALFDPPCSISENGHSSPSDMESPVAISVDEKALKEHADHDLRVVLHLDGFYEGMDVEIRIILFDTPVQMSPSEIAQKW